MVVAHLGVNIGPRTVFRNANEGRLKRFGKAIGTQVRGPMSTTPPASLLKGTSNAEIDKVLSRRPTQAPLATLHADAFLLL